MSRLELYDEESLKRILLRSAKILDIELNENGAGEIARRSRGTPRIANRFLKRVRDYAQVIGDGVITEQIANDALKLLEVDKLGLDSTDKNVIMTIIEKFGGGPVGLDTLSAATGEERTTIEDVYEPYLLQLGFLNRTPRGRVVTKSCYEYFEIKFENQ